MPIHRKDPIIYYIIRDLLFTFRRAAILSALIALPISLLPVLYRKAVYILIRWHSALVRNFFFCRDQRLGKCMVARVQDTVLSGGIVSVVVPVSSGSRNGQQKGFSWVSSRKPHFTTTNPEREWCPTPRTEIDSLGSSEGPTCFFNRIPREQDWQTIKSVVV